MGEERGCRFELVCPWSDQKALSGQGLVESPSQLACANDGARLTKAALRNWGGDNRVFFVCFFSPVFV